MARQAHARDEQETTISYDSGEAVVRIYTCRPADVARMAKAGVKSYDGNDFNGFRYKVPLARLFWKIRPLVSAYTSKNRVGFKRSGAVKRAQNGTPEQA